MKRIVAAVDGSDTGRSALGWAVEEARVHGARVIAVHAWSEPPVGTYSLDAFAVDPEVFRLAAQEVLDHDVAEVTGAGDEAPEIESRLVQGGASGVIIDAASGADLVVVGSRGRGGFAGLLLGSVSQQVVHHAPCPVVVIPTARS
jgi:nucleotide-binding universal stress UspA family protein